VIARHFSPNFDVRHCYSALYSLAALAIGLPLHTLISAVTLSYICTLTTHRLFITPILAARHSEARPALHRTERNRHV
jgi:hypothetical protein